MTSETLSNLFLNILLSYKITSSSFLYYLRSIFIHVVPIDTRAELAESSALKWAKTELHAGSNQSFLFSQDISEIPVCPFTCLFVFLFFGNTFNKAYVIIKCEYGFF